MRGSDQLIPGRCNLLAPRPPGSPGGHQRCGSRARARLAGWRAVGAEGAGPARRGCPAPDDAAPAVSPRFLSLTPHHGCSTKQQAPEAASSLRSGSGGRRRRSRRKRRRKRRGIAASQTHSARGCARLSALGPRRPHRGCPRPRVPRPARTWNKVAGGGRARGLQPGKLRSGSADGGRRRRRRSPRRRPEQPGRRRRPGGRRGCSSSRGAQPIAVGDQERRGRRSDFAAPGPEPVFPPVAAAPGCARTADAGEPRASRGPPGAARTAERRGRRSALGGRGGPARPQPSSASLSPAPPPK